MFSPARVISLTLRQTSFTYSSRALLVPSRPFACSLSPQFHTSAAKMVPPEARKITSDHPEKVRMLVLETDEPHPDTQKEKGSFGEILNDLLVKAGEAHRPKLAIETVMQYVIEPDGGKIPKKEEITEDIHAILITGSVWDAHGDDEWIHKLMDLIRRRSFLAKQLAYVLTSSRFVDPPSRHSVLWNMLRASDTLPNTRFESRSREERRLGASTFSHHSFRCRSQVIQHIGRSRQNPSTPNAS